MRKSKLELYEVILGALVDKYLSVDSLAYECKMDCVAANKRLEFLMKNSLVKTTQCNKKVLYSLTTRGESIYKTLKITKRLNRLKKSVKVINETVQAFPEIAKRNSNRK